MFSIVLLVGLLLLVLCLRIVVKSCTLPRAMAARAACGGCGYEFTGWSQCPECGREVAEVGVLTPALALSQRGSVWGAAMALLFVVGIGAAALASASLVLAGSQGYYEATRQERFAPYPGRGNTVSRALYEVEVLSDVLAGPSGAVNGTLTVVVVPGGVKGNVFDGTPPPGEPKAVVEVRSRRVTLYDAAGGVLGRHGSFGIEAAEALYAAAGLSTKDEFYRVGAEDLVRRVEAALATPVNTGWGALPTFDESPGRLLAGGSGGSSSATVPIQVLGLQGSAAVLVLTLIGAVTAYAAALTWVVRPRRRLLTR